MLLELSVRDLGVIQSLALHLQPGMTALTGETGAGKTLVVEAIELLTGGRADPVLVRPGANEAVVEGRFLIAEEERILTRIVPARGRSRAYLDGRMAPTSALEELARDLVDLHGQHGHQSLLRPLGQRQALDAFGGVDTGPLRRARSRVAELERSLAGMGGDARTRLRELDLLDHQLGEIAAAGLSDPDEPLRLEAEEDLLAAAAEHRARAGRAHDLLVGDEGVLDLVGTALATLAGSAPLADSHRRLSALAAEAADVGSELRALAESIAEDPGRLEEVRRRRALLHDLTRKYGDTLEEVLSFARQGAERRHELGAHDEAVARLEAELEQARRTVTSEESEVRARRSAAAPELSRRVGEHLSQLALPSARIEVEVGEDGPGDEVVFAFSANPGSPLLPLAKIASGGELARVMLAVRLVVSAGPPVLVFDEVDAGVGGEAALAVGSALSSLATDRQVLVVTHLAQVAAYADHQVAVRKVVEDDTTRTDIAVLGPEDRVVELSRMLAGQPDSATARLHASELLELGRRALSR